MPFKIVRNDITKMQVDAIVNTANEAPVYADGIDLAVYRAAGEEKLLAKRREIGYLREGEAVITPGYQLPAKYIIHAVSPRYIDGKSKEGDRLRSCYRKSLELAVENRCRSIAFPLIATGNFGYPKEEGMRIAVDEIHAFLLHHTMQIYLVVFDGEATRLGKSIYPDLEAYIDCNYVAAKREEEYSTGYTGSIFDTGRLDVPKQAMPDPNSSIRSKIPKGSRRAESLKSSMRSKSRENSMRSEISENPRPIEASIETDDIQESIQADDFRESQRLEELEVSVEAEDYDELVDEIESALELRMRHMTDTFQQYLLYLIESKGYTNAEVYNRAIIKKQLFSKIKLNDQYHPDKATAMRLCIGAKLNLDETKDLLARAGYALSPCNKRDIIFSYFIEKKIYDMIEIDIALEEHGEPCFIE